MMSLPFYGPMIHLEGVWSVPGGMVCPRGRVWSVLGVCVCKADLPEVCRSPW